MGQKDGSALKFFPSNQPSEEYQMVTLPSGKLSYTMEHHLFFHRGNYKQIKKQTINELYSKLPEKNILEDHVTPGRHLLLSLSAFNGCVAIKAPGYPCDLAKASCGAGAPRDVLVE